MLRIDAKTVSNIVKQYWETGIAALYETFKLHKNSHYMSFPHFFLKPECGVTAYISVLFLGYCVTITHLVT